MKPKILRKRIIPDEEVDISGDELLSWEEDGMVTRWLPIRPREDIGWGLSYTSFRKHYKISAFYDTSGDFLYWYCDVVTVRYEPETYTLVVKDLLADVRLYPGREPEVLDWDELEKASRLGWITEDERLLAEQTVEALLELIRQKRFPPSGFHPQQYGPPAAFVPAAPLPC